MRIIPFLVSLVITVALITALNMRLPVDGAKTPRLGAFLSPQYGCWQNAEPLDADFNANLRLPGLSGKVNVYFDDRLVPHIYAENDKDAYFVQGYIHAKFRLWQMEFQTHLAGGRLSEIMGAKSGTINFLTLDKFFRRSGMVYAAEQSLKEVEANPETKNSTDAYTAGINAYINTITEANELPLEYKLLDYKPEPWTNLKTALFLKYMSYDLAGGESDFEMTNARKLFSAADIEKLYPVIGDTLDPIIPKGTLFDQAGLVVKKPMAADSAYYNESDTMQPAFMKPDKDNGSNNWAVAGSKTSSGRPILCNDPHLLLNLPSLWYEMQITTPNFNTYGVTFPGAPSVIIGFNDSCAWGFTNAGRDVKDYYEIKFADTTMQQYWFNGSLTKAGVRKEVIKIRGEADDVETIAMTVFGPVMYDHSYPNKSKDDKYYAVRWKAHDASNELLTFSKLNRAKDYIDYADAISTYKCPGQNMLFATKTGDIALRQQGEFPAKWKRQGDFVMPGSDSTYMWQGNIPMMENPMMKNPARGFLSSANQLPVDETYPYYLGGSFPPYRGWLINRMLNSMNAITIEDMERMQTDNYNVFAEMARPVLLNHLNATNLNADQQFFSDNLRNWNLRNDTNEVGATIFTVWWDSLEAEIFRDELAQTKLTVRWPDESTLLESLLKDTAYKFADNINTAAKETVYDVVQSSFLKACKQLQIFKNKNTLAWGINKNTGVKHLLRIPALSRLSLPIGGGNHIINATKHDHGPSWRMIVELTDPIQAVGVYPGGQSGNPGSRFYDSFIDTWALGKYYPLLFLPKLEAEAAKDKKIKWTMTFNKV